MSIGRELKRRGRVLLAPAIFLSITGFFGWNATRATAGWSPTHSGRSC